MIGGSEAREIGVAVSHSFGAAEGEDGQRDRQQQYHRQNDGDLPAAADLSPFGQDQEGRGERDDADQARNPRANVERCVVIGRLQARQGNTGREGDRHGYGGQGRGDDVKQQDVATGFERPVSTGIDPSQRQPADLGLGQCADGSAGGKDQALRKPGAELTDGEVEGNKEGGNTHRYQDLAPPECARGDRKPRDSPDGHEKAGWQGQEQRKFAQHEASQSDTDKFQGGVHARYDLPKSAHSNRRFAFRENS